MAKSAQQAVRKRGSKTVSKSPPRKSKFAAPTTKLEQIIAALRTPKGASISQLVDLTGWQIHSVRGALAGALKKKRGLKVISSKPDGERIYRIEGGK